MYSQRHVISCYGIDKRQVYFPVSRNSRSYLRNATSLLACLLPARKRCCVACAFVIRTRASSFCMLTFSLIYSEIISHRFIIREAIRAVRLAWDLKATVKLLVPRDSLIAWSAPSCRIRRRCAVIPRWGSGTLYLDAPLLNTWPRSRKTGKIYDPSKHDRGRNTRNRLAEVACVKVPYAVRCGIRDICQRDIILTARSHRTNSNAHLRITSLLHSPGYYSRIILHRMYEGPCVFSNKRTKSTRCKKYNNVPRFRNKAVALATPHSFHSL